MRGVSIWPGNFIFTERGQGLAVVAQQLLPFLGRTEADIPPRKARDDLARAAVQRQLGVRIQICLQVGGVQREDVVCPGVEPPGGRAADEVTRLRGGDLGRLSQLSLHLRRLLSEGGDLGREVRDFTRDDPELVLSEDVVFFALGCLVVGRAVQRIHHIIKRGSSLFFQRIQLGGGGILRALQKLDLVVQARELLAEARLFRAAVDLRYCSPRRDALAVGREIAQRSAAGNIDLIEEENSVGVHRIRHGGKKRRLVGVGREEYLQGLIAHIDARQHHDSDDEACQLAQSAGRAGIRAWSIHHKRSPFR